MLFPIEARIDFERCASSFFCTMARYKCFFVTANVIRAFQYLLLRNTANKVGLPPVTVLEAAQAMATPSSTVQRTSIYYYLKMNESSLLSAKVMVFSHFCNLFTQIETAQRYTGFNWMLFIYKLSRYVNTHTLITIPIYCSCTQWERN